MKRGIEEIVTALEVIRDVCKEFDNDCTNCPLRVPSGECGKVSCGVHNSYPHSWKAKRPDKWIAIDFEI